jgi:Glycosyl transferase family 4 group
MALDLRKAGFIPDVMLGHNGWGEIWYLKEIADRIIEALEDSRSFTSLRKNARQTIVDQFDLQSICLPAHLRLLNMLVPRENRASLAPMKAIATR